MSADIEYARHCRDAVRPVECTRAPECWADHGGGERLLERPGHWRAQACAACNGNVKTAAVPWPPNFALG